MPFQEDFSTSQGIVAWIGIITKNPVIARRYVVPTWQSRKKNSKKCYENYYFLDCHAACSGITVESEKVVIKLLQFFTTRERNNHNIAILLVVIFISHKEYFRILFLTFNSYVAAARNDVTGIYATMPPRPKLGNN